MHLHLLKNKILALFFYNIFLRLYVLGVRIASLKSKKATLWLKGRAGILTAIATWRTNIGENEKVIWIHCASLGEFEQGRPLLEKIKIQYPSYKIILTFFSPSGLEIRKNYTKADGIFYLPIDSKKNAANFIKILKPSLVIWVKYEYWFYYLNELKNKNIPVILVSAIFRETQPFFKWYGSLWKEILCCFNKIFVQNENSVTLLKKIGFSKNVLLTGDTRFDSVIEIAENKISLPNELISFCTNNKVLVAGSTWLEDEEILVHFARSHKDVKFIIAPHKVEEERIKEIEKLFDGAVRYSDFIAGKAASQVIIVDNIGMLSNLYKFATVAYIGGGFNDSGIHNILEAAVYGKPIVFGEEYEKFNEAVDLVKLGAAFSFENVLELETLLIILFNDKAANVAASIISKNYVLEKQGATQNILEYLRQISF